MASLSELATVTFITMIITMFAGDSAARDLRPSDHGLQFQNSPPSPHNSSTEMRSFFNSSPTSTSSDVSLPHSTDFLPPPLPISHGGGGGRWGGALTVASLVCGITGVILLVASALLYIFIVKKKPRNENHTLNDSFRHIIDNDNDNVNKLHFVPVVNNI